MRFETPVPLARGFRALALGRKVSCRSIWIEFPFRDIDHDWTKDSSNKNSKGRSWVVLQITVSFGGPFYKGAVLPPGPKKRP